MPKTREPKDAIFIPNEIVENIISNVPHGAGLLNIALVCKRFQVLVWPHLFRTIRLRAEWREDSDYFSVAWHEPPTGLVSGISRLPLKGYLDFCKYVKSLSLKVENEGWYENPCGHGKLLNFLPSLEELSLHLPPHQYDFPMRDGLDTMKLNFTGTEYHDFYDSSPCDLWDYLSKPTLRRLQIQNMPYPIKSFHRTAYPRSSQISDLRVTHWPEDIRVLEPALSLIGDLEHFVLEARGQWLVHPTLGPIHGLEPLDYGSLLQRHSGSLKELIIAYSDEVHNNNSEHSPRRASPLIGSLKHYHNLKRLAIAEPFLVSLRDQTFLTLLPPQLEELQIQYPIGNSAEDRQIDPTSQPCQHLLRIKQLAKNKIEYLPRLKRMVWWFQQTPRRISPRETPAWNNTYRYEFDATPSRHLNPTTDPIYGPPKYLIELAEDFRKVEVKFEFVLACSFRDTPFAEYLDL